MAQYHDECHDKGAYHEQTLPFDVQSPYQDDLAQCGHDSESTIVATETRCSSR